MPSRHLAVAASAAHPDLRPDWPRLRAALARRHIAAETAVWTDTDVDWGQYDLVLANGAWDHIHRPDAFLQWAERVASVTCLQNAVPILRWNHDKRYLQDLASAGVPTVPTTWTTSTNEEVPLPAVEFVIKPTISGGGFETARYGIGDHQLARQHISRLHDAGRTAMIQPYLPSVDHHGEVGLIMLGGTFSHAINKGPLLRPGAGTQTELWRNEHIELFTPTEAQLQVASAALSVAEGRFGPTTYARIDVVELPDGSPAILELELLDPALFLETNELAADRFAGILGNLLDDAWPEQATN